MTHRPNIVVLAVLLLALFVGWSAWQWRQAENDVSYATEQLKECRRLARRIGQLRLTPAKFEDSLRSNAALAQLVEKTVQQAGVDKDRIAEISPGEPRRVGDTPYKEQETRVVLREVTLRQLMEFALAVPESDPGITIATLALRTPVGTIGAAKQAETPEFWNAELLLTSQFYEPIVESSP